MRLLPAIALVLVLAAQPLPGSAIADAPAVAGPDDGAQALLRIEPARLTPGFWIARLHDPDRVLLDRQAIAAQNARLARDDDSVRDLRTMPASLERAQVLGWIRRLSVAPDKPLYGIDGKQVAATRLQGLVDALALDAVPARQATRFGMVVRRADLRSFPTTLRVFSQPGDTDIDRFQESAMFPGTPVVIAHASRDGRWLFVLGPRYAAWTQARNVAEGSRAQVFDHLDKSPYRIVTGAKLRTVFTREQPQLSELQLDMGVRVPLAVPPAGQPVNGQNPYTSLVLELPLRADDGSLRFAPALLPKTADTSDAPLPLTRGNIIGQAFKFLGERYGWGHSFNGRDCSGFVSEVYRSMGVVLPRNTGDQANSPALPHTAFGDSATVAEREAAVARLQVGDLVYIPGHVMLVIGRIDGVPWVIHDIQNGRMLDAGGRLGSLHLNAVAVTPLPPLRFDDSVRFIDRISSIVRIGARQAPAPRPSR